MHAALPKSGLAWLPRAWRATRVVLHAAEGLATTLCVFPFVGVAQKRALIRHWSARLLKHLHIDARMQGAIDARQGNVLIVANHVSWLDIFVVNAQQPARFVAKSDLARWPFAGKLIRDAGTIFIERERRSDTRRVNQRAAQALVSGDVVAVFPEGTTSDGVGLLRFHASLMQPVVDSRGIVQPVALRYRDANGAHSMAPTYGDETFAASFWRVCGERRLVVDVTASPPIPAAGVHRRELAHAAYDAIRTALGCEAAGTGPGTGGDRAG